jgi:hypothetical protein
MANDLEAARQQMMETEAMLSPTNDKGIPVSPRDNHKVHLKVGIPDMTQAVRSLGQMPAHPQTLGKIALGLTHFEAHTTEWLKAGGDPKEIKPYQNALKQLDGMLKKAALGAAQQMQAMDDMQAQAEQEQQQGGPTLPTEQLIEIYLGKDTPDTIKRQIEQKLGFTPPTPQEMQEEHAREATLKHPDLPEKVAAAAAGPQPPPQADQTPVMPDTESPPEDSAEQEEEPAQGPMPPPPTG